MLYQEAGHPPVGVVSPKTEWYTEKTENLSAYTEKQRRRDGI